MKLTYRFHDENIRLLELPPSGRTRGRKDEMARR
jgi:hypothetical protein